MEKGKKPTKEEVMKMLERQEIEGLKIELDRYINTIARSAFIENCTSGAYFNEMFNDTLLRTFDTIQASKLSQKEKDDLQLKFSIMSDRTPQKDYLKNKVSYARCMLINLSEDKKKEIIHDCISQEMLAFKQFDVLSNAIKELEKRKAYVPLKKETEEKTNG